jgi:hypothetical protein
MRRRDFIPEIVVSIAMPLAARAQQQDRGRRLRVLIYGVGSRCRREAVAWPLAATSAASECPLRSFFDSDQV